MITIDKIQIANKEYSSVVLLDESKDLNHHLISSEYEAYIKLEFKERKRRVFTFNNLDNYLIVIVFPQKKTKHETIENLRSLGAKTLEFLDKEFIRFINLSGNLSKEEILGFAEGIALSSYCFDNYKTDPERLIHPFDHISIIHDEVSTEDIRNSIIIYEAVEKAKDLVNEPYSALNAEQLSASLVDMGREAGIEVEVLDKKKIEELKMGGILAVNKGSVVPPSFTIMEYKPENAKNTKPIVLVGKGVVYDTGGLNIKVSNFMYDMKSDMGGAAMMGAAIYAIARLGLPYHIITLVPATDNRPSGEAYASGDIINMYDGTNVEVVNTDAEGRVILADALAYSKKYDPCLIINSATLTGAAERAIGRYGIVAMENNAEGYLDTMKKAGNDVYERIAEFPFWSEYDELIKSDIADIKNSVFGGNAGMITAGKFLSYFTGNIPFIHLDIAGVALSDKKYGYIPKGGTGYGVRLIIKFIEDYFSELNQ